MPKISLTRLGRSRRLRRLIVAGGLGAALSIVTVASANLWIRDAAAGHVYSLDTVPEAPVALVLGAQVDPGGAPSAFLAARLDLARALYQAGKVRAILVSGDHAEWSYDEPGAMLVYLVARGVPADRVVMDHAGFDTYDSCARAGRIFGVRRAILVTQSFHVPRAVALCRTLGIDASGVGDDTVRADRPLWARGQVREWAAAVKAGWDAATRRDPVFLGRHETGVETAVAAG
ncbi:SanA/YdcF family protein [Actinoplanes teichomyceticus]|uniref:Vancomycin permeability regulator SanA n=1 Tax=Actinoplanes teichomyceticus TaxID=1867 RepID=A0A561VR74_ACTTI|nr:ElyC/SanA/YdcF family protein [Actinoplanes teichomyceticus]TWG14119.1 vancomycin permeability regulator SanA [Actinoplanes teichomyceticus]